MSSLEQQQEKLKKLNEKIKAEKEKIDKKLGHDIIKKSGIDYSDLGKNDLNSLSDKISEFLLKEISEQSSEQSSETVDIDDEKNDDKTISNSEQADLNNHNEY